MCDNRCQTAKLLNKIVGKRVNVYHNDIDLDCPLAIGKLCPHTKPLWYQVNDVVFSVKHVRAVGGLNIFIAPTERG